VPRLKRKLGLACRRNSAQMNCIHASLTATPCSFGRERRPSGTPPAAHAQRRALTGELHLHRRIRWCTAGGAIPVLAYVVMHLSYFVR
jgi:hypothetical protein